MTTRRIGNRDTYDPNAAYQDTFGDGRYAKRFHTILKSTARVITREAHRIIQPDDDLTLLDFGCGEGRWREILDQLSRDGIPTNYIGYDPVKVGLTSFKDKLLKEGYVVTGEQNHPDNHPGYIMYNLTREKCKVTLILGNLDDSIEHTKKLIGPVDMAMSMFGPLNCIPGRENRQATLRMLGDLASGRVIATVFSNRFIDRFNPYNRKLKIEIPKGAEVEPGDVTYSSGGSGRRWFHVYTADELKQDLHAAGLKPQGGIKVSNIVPQSILLKSSSIAFFDSIASRFVSTRHLQRIGLNRVARCFLVVCDGKRIEQTVERTTGFADKVIEERERGEEAKGR